MKSFKYSLFVAVVLMANAGTGAFGQASSQPSSAGQPLAPVMANPDRAPNELHVGVGQVGRPVTGDVVAPQPVEKAMMDLGLMGAKDDPYSRPGMTSGSFGTSGLGNFAAPNAFGNLGNTSDPTQMNATTQPGLTPSPAAEVEGEITDKLFLQAWEKFHQALYRDCVDLLRNDVRAGRAVPQARLLYAASLVATGQMASAGFETTQAAKEDPKNFFATVRQLAKRYRAETDFPAHFDAAKKYGRDSKSVEPGLLWAFYQTMEGSEENDPSVTLTLLHPGPQEAEWFPTLVNSLSKKTLK